MCSLPNLTNPRNTRKHQNTKTQDHVQNTKTQGHVDKRGTKIRSYGEDSRILQSTCNTHSRECLRVKDCVPQHYFRGRGATHHPSSGVEGNSQIHFWWEQLAYGHLWEYLERHSHRKQDNQGSLGRRVGWCIPNHL